MRTQDSPFDSQHYGLRIAHLHPDPDDGERELAASVAAARDAGIDVLFLRLAERAALRPVVERTHRSIDTLVTSMLHRPAPIVAHPDVPIEEHARLSGDDVAAVARITAASMRTSHLHADPRLPLERTQALYAAWATNDVTGRATRTIVARERGAVVGYIAVVAPPGEERIDLIAVDPAHHGRGIGSAMLARFVATAGPVATVGTQQENPALWLYARHGFVPTATHFSYHLWLQ